MKIKRLQIQDIVLDGESRFWVLKYLTMLNMYLINIIMLSVIESEPRVCYNKRNKKEVFMDGGVLL